MTDVFDDGASDFLPVVNEHNAGDKAAIIFDLLFKTLAVTGAGARLAAGVSNVAIAATEGTAAGALVSSSVPVLAYGFLPIASALIGLYWIGRANERAHQQGFYSAFLGGFAQSLSDFSRGVDRRRQNVVYRTASVQGRNSAIEFVNSLDREKRTLLFHHLRSMGDVEATRYVLDRLRGRTQ